ncbi:hypothetical protein D3C76_1385710 [compost metagenome]
MKVRDWIDLGSITPREGNAPCLFQMSLVWLAFRDSPGLAEQLGAWSSETPKIFGITFDFAFVKETGLALKS